MFVSRYQRILCLVLAATWLADAVPLAAQEEAPRVHFLLAVDTVDRLAQVLGLDLDGKNMEDVIRWAMTKQGLAEGERFTLKVLSGTNMSEKTVLDYYRRLKTGPGETLVFYYTGHGGFYPDKGHLLSMRNFLNVGGGKTQIRRADIDRAELLAAMARHNPRAMIVLTDCCASSELPVIAGGIRPTAPDTTRRPVLKGAGDGQVLRDLFFRASGVVNITAARTGSPARGERAKGGSFFTIALAKLLKEDGELIDRDGNKHVDWREFFPHLEKQTELESLILGKTIDGRAYANFHTPEAFMLEEPIRSEKVVDNAVQELLGRGRLNPVMAADDDLTARHSTITKSGQKFYAREYQLGMGPPVSYLINLHSSHFDTLLYIKDATGKTVASNDDYGTTTTRSRLLFHPPAEGQYRIGITSYGAEETGRFCLTVQESTFLGELAATDAKDRYCLGAYSKLHPIRLTAHRSYSIQLESDQFDAYLRVEDRFGNTVALNDDEDASQGRLNAVISFRTVTTDTFFVVVTSFAPERTGKYAVFVQD